MAKDTKHEQDDGPMSERVIFPISKALLQEITDYRFEHRIDSRSEAIRRLIEAGLKAESGRGRREQK